MINIRKIQEILKSESKFRTKQVYEAVFSRFVESWDEISSLPASLREKLKNEASLEIKAEVLESADKHSVKAVIVFPGGRVETVLLRHGDGRNTVCVSSQIGCLLGCDFCLTGQSGFSRSLDSYEIVEQVLFFSRYLKTHPVRSGTVHPSREGNSHFERVSNVVFMGMGEPFLNYDEVMKAIRFLNDKETFNIGARKISVSTCGIIEGIKKFSKEPLQLNLAISLHAPNDEIRRELMPVAFNNPMLNLLRTIKSYIEKTNRKVMIEYIMLDKINDSEADAKELALILKKYIGRLFVVNLISYNQTQKYKSSDIETIERFKEILEREGLEVVQRHKLGREIKGACGQLAHERKK